MTEPIDPGPVIGSVTVACPVCNATLAVPVHARLDAVTGEGVLVHVHTEYAVIESHLFACPGSPDDDGEPMPVKENVA